MAGIKDIVDDLVELGALVAPIVIGPAGTAAVQIARKLIETGERVKDQLGETDQAALEAMISELQVNVDAHERQTFGNLDRI